LKENVVHDTPETSPDSPIQFDIRSFYYRRFTRILPSYLFSLFIYCFILFPNGLYPRSYVQSDFLQWIFKQIIPNETMIPTNNSFGAILQNILFVNYLSPFGGTMGWVK
jgi:peptidoglycan/LPS O-acetylase OafA/YrhL